MKVICIDDGFNPKGVNDPENLSKIKVGSIYTVKRFLERAYNFYEITHSREPYTGWITERFIPISEIDETEFERNYQKQTV